jgi:hypothetical protein
MLRSLVATILGITIVISPVISPAWGATGAEFGTVVAADRAHLGSGSLSAGATVFGGDRLFTDDTGSLQLRAGAARLLLASASNAVLANDPVVPSASLTRGTAIFSTANSKAFVLRVGNMVIKPQTDQPTVAQVTVVGPKQLAVRSTRGSLTVSVDDDMRVIPEGVAYRIVLDPSAAELAAADDSSTQGPEGVGVSGGRGHGPHRAGRSRFVWFVIGGVAIGTAIALWEVLESPDRTN